MYVKRFGWCCGVDEVGRGALAGPVVAAAVTLRRGIFPKGLRDSKKLSKLKREQLFEDIKGFADYGIGLSTAQEIDGLNILQASLLAMRRAVNNLKVTPGVVLVDGIHLPNKLPQFGLAIISGDTIIPAIAASSIIAKVYRDNLMLKLSVSYPEYGWDKNVGYGTDHHLMALKKYGITPEHRCSFSPVYNI